MKRFFVAILTLVMLCSVMFCTPVSAASFTESNTVVEYLENGDYIRTTISWVENSTRSTKTAEKTKEHVSANGNILWTVTVRGTFYYNGSTSSCTAVSHSTTAPSSYWTIKSASSSKSGNKATATATATLKVGSTTSDETMTVTLTCSVNGTLS